MNRPADIIPLRAPALARLDRLQADISAADARHEVEVMWWVLGFVAASALIAAALILREVLA